jgi:hypothetical protein
MEHFQFAPVFPTPCYPLPLPTDVTSPATRSRGVCGHYGESGQGEEPCNNPSHRVNCSETRACPGRKCPVILQEKATQELRVNYGISFLDALKKFLAYQPTTGNQSSPAAVRRPHGFGAATQTTALLNRGGALMSPRTTMSTV